VALVPSFPSGVLSFFKACGSGKRALWPSLSPDAQSHIAQREGEAHKRISELGQTVLASKLRGQFPDLEISLRERFDDAGLLVNAMSLGLNATDAMPTDPAKLPRDCAVFDIIAARRTELFMEACAARGLRVVDGVAIIKHQLPLQTAFWRGET
jgi:shikimate 5-dehydrogenase